jgi:hypothetical protein
MVDAVSVIVNESSVVLWGGQRTQVGAKSILHGGLLLKKQNIVFWFQRFLRLTPESFWFTEP